jgi:hypothetical protein
MIKGRGVPGVTAVVVGVSVGGRGEGKIVAVLVLERGSVKFVGVDTGSVTTVTMEVGVGVGVRIGSEVPHRLVQQADRSIPVRTSKITPLCMTEFIGQIIPHLSCPLISTSCSWSFGNTLSKG